MLALRFFLNIFFLPRQSAQWARGIGDHIGKYCKRRQKIIYILGDFLIIYILFLVVMILYEIVNYKGKYKKQSSMRPIIYYYSHIIKKMY